MGKILILLMLLVPLVYGQGAPPSNRPSTGVQLYLPYENRILPDYSMIHGGQFFTVDINVDSINDALYCQSANSGSNIGVWYYPDGTQVPLFTGSLGDYSAPTPLYSKRFTGQIALARTSGLWDVEGLYTCVIPDENGTDHTLVVGIYTYYTYNNNNGPDADPSMKLSLISTRDANPPVFTLSFNVSDGPPTDVICTTNWTNNNSLTIANNDVSRVIVDGPGSVTQVTVTVRMRMRQASTYHMQCTVSNDRVTAGTIGSVTAMNSTSSSLIQPSSGYFQFKIKRVKSDCLTWSLAETRNFEIVIKNRITSLIKEKCPRCPFLLSDGEFVCTSDPQSPIYRGTYFTLDLSINNILNVIQNWVKDGASFVYEMRRYHIDRRCPVIIKSFNDEECKFHL